ncbi:MAG: hypothetical protein JOZ54_03075, partial [Acidobacteria bacterium]|nr:hypothetical protein [Acidobacteriota bacterium]
RTGTPTTTNADGTYKSGSGLFPFNPFTDKPKQCPTGASAQECFNMKANYQFDSKFGQATSPDAYQVADRSLAPRTYRFSLGLRF